MAENDDADLRTILQNQKKKPGAYDGVVAAPDDSIHTLMYVMMMRNPNRVVFWLLNTKFFITYLLCQGLIIHKTSNNPYILHATCLNYHYWFVTSNQLTQRTAEAASLNAPGTTHRDGITLNSVTAMHVSTTTFSWWNNTHISMSRKDIRHPHPE